MFVPAALTSWPIPALPYTLPVPEELRLIGLGTLTPPASSTPAPQPLETVTALVAAPRAAEFSSRSVPAETVMPLTQAAGPAEASTSRPLSLLMIWVVELALAKAPV